LEAALQLRSWTPFRIGRMKQGGSQWCTSAAVACCRAFSLAPAPSSRVHSPLNPIRSTPCRPPLSSRRWNRTRQVETWGFVDPSNPQRVSPIPSIPPIATIATINRARFDALSSRPWRQRNLLSPGRLLVIDDDIAADQAHIGIALRRSVLRNGERLPSTPREKRVLAHIRTHCSVGSGKKQQRIGVRRTRNGRAKQTILDH